MRVTKLTIVTHITARTDQIELVKDELEKLINITRAAASCLQFDLHQDNENPAHFLFYENWESRDLWHKHMEAARRYQSMPINDIQAQIVDAFNFRHATRVFDPKRKIGAGEFIKHAYQKFQEHDFHIAGGCQISDWAARQACIALGNMMMAAALMGIDSCPIEGFERNKTITVIEKNFAMDP
jgi:quinol monooxygenase YgiN